MPTVSEYFATPTYTFAVHTEAQLQVAGEAISVTLPAHYDFISGASYVSYFVPATDSAREICLALIADPAFALREARGMEFAMEHSTLAVQRVNAHDLPFSGRMYLYVDVELPKDEIAALYSAGRAANLNLEIQDARYARERSALEVPRAFISHDSRDKDEIVRPLATKLREMMCPVWYDEFSLEVGDSLRESIDRGLQECPRCIVVLSANFFANDGWTKAEFNAVWNRHVKEGGGVLLPIWHGVSRDEVAGYSAMVVDTVALNSEIGVEELARVLYGKLIL